MKIKVYCRKTEFTADQPCCVELDMSVDEPLAPGSKIEVQFPNSWCLFSGPSFTREFQHEDPEAPHHFSVVAEQTALECDYDVQGRHLVYPEGPFRHGRLLSAVIKKGEVAPGRTLTFRYANTYAPYVAREEEVWVRINGRAPERAPVIRVVPLRHETIRVIVPSSVEPGKEFDVLIVSFDRFENISCSEFKDETLCMSDGGKVVDKLDFTGALRVPVTLTEEGVHRFIFKDTLSNAVKLEMKPRGPFWGDIHIHTGLSHDAQGGDPYVYARKAVGLDFGAAADHWDSLGPDGYRMVEEWAEKHNTPGEFVTLPADERNPSGLPGHHNVYFRNTEAFRRSMAVKGRGCKASPEEEMEFLDFLDPAEAMVIPHHSGIQWSDLEAGSAGRGIRWDSWHNDALRPVVEIYSHHGQSELYAPQHVLAYEFNRMRNRERRANTSSPGPCYAQDYWMQGHRPGVIASSDEHSGQAGRRHGGIASVFADELTRESVFDAIRARDCYATTGERILVNFSVDGLEIGKEAKREKGAELEIKLDVWGTETLLRVEILRYRFGIDSMFVPIVSVSPKPESMDAHLCISDELVCSTVYYARVTQEPIEWIGMAWTSPIWVDTGGSADG